MCVYIYICLSLCLSLSLSLPLSLSLSLSLAFFLSLFAFFSLSPSVATWKSFRESLGQYSSSHQVVEEGRGATHRMRNDVQNVSEVFSTFCVTDLLNNILFFSPNPSETLRKPLRKHSKNRTPLRSSPPPLTESGRNLVHQPSFPRKKKKEWRGFTSLSRVQTHCLGSMWSQWLIHTEQLMAIGMEDGGEVLLIVLISPSLLILPSLPLSLLPGCTHIWVFGSCNFM